MTFRAALLLSLLLPLPFSLPAAANDSIAELKTGGLVFVTTDTIQMKEEDLYISMEEVKVDYVYANTGTEDQTLTVAFPMPDIDGNPYVPMAIPVEQTNFLNFTVEVDGEAIEPMVQQRAVASGIDYTDLLVGYGVPLEPFGDATARALDALPAETISELQGHGLVIKEVYDAGNGMVAHWWPIWKLRQTYYWEMTFLAGEETRVSHRYTPSVGGTVGVSFVYEGKPNGDGFADYKTRYCMDDSFVKTAMKVGTYTEAGPNYYESRVSYILTTGANWSGPIGKFRLTIDKGSPDNFVSFCGDGVKKTGPTTFVVEQTDFYPTKDLDILFLVKQPPLGAE